MNFLVDKILATTTVISLIGGIVNINPSFAAIIGYNMKFFDNSDNQIGSGEFTYDADTITCIQTAAFGDSCDQFNGRDVKTELISFSANILGTEWRFNDRSGQLWWDENSNSVLGAIPNGPDIFVDKQWFFGNQFSNRNFLSIEGQSGENSGTWKQVLNFDVDNSLNGKWTAMLKKSSPSNHHIVPEPLTLLGTAIAIGFGTFFKIKLK
ncbi:PEP-CTERM sorting domain-containing protein [Crocosphaera chwakensis]|uniref:PEP-CTERM protein-sorting domain-containing protein n=1 Tax=Crocosphaera chwakensis CCY0110 TaxID=391612 RepID=A3IM40_9CHRO|nr:PEP-CTERM sorting domain-containing protein [Crocosphaera chwakensis]EAZ92496.1 hypothetical protein CY0110_02184 [Crocosphaera chwakensis CCY0110]